MKSRASSQGFMGPLQVPSGLRGAVSGLNRTAGESIVTEADETQANSSLIMRDIRKLLQLPSSLAAGFHNECKYLWDQRTRHKTTTKPSMLRQRQHETQPSAHLLHLLPHGLKATGLGNGSKQTRFNSQARVRRQRVHLGVPAVVVDGVSFCHPQHWTLAEH